MANKYSKIILAALAALCLALPASAQEARVVTLDQAIKEALAYSPNIEAAGQDVKAAEHGRKEAFTHYLPELTTSYNWQRVENPTEISTPAGTFITSTENTYLWSTGFTQPIFTGWRITSTYRLAELGVDLAQVNLELARQDVVLNVKEAYFNYLRSLKNVEVRQQSVKLLASQLETSRAFFDAALIPVNDVLKIEVELAQAKQNLVTARNQAAINQARLNKLMGRPVDQPLAAEDLLRHFQVDLTYGAALAQAQKMRPEIKAMDVRLKQANQSIRQAKSNYYPDVVLQGSYDFTSDSPELGDSDQYDATGWTIAAGLQWNFWSWGRTASQVGQQRAQKLKVKALRRDLEDQVELQVKESYLFLREAGENIGTAKAAVVQAEENYRVTNERYKEQLTTNTELLDAQTLLTQARSNYYTALTVYNVAYANLLRAMGRES